jgi:hypothetical protein
MSSFANWIYFMECCILKYQMNHYFFFQFITKVHFWSIEISTLFFCMHVIHCGTFFKFVCRIHRMLQP